MDCKKSSRSPGFVLKGPPSCIHRINDRKKQQWDQKSTQYHSFTQQIQDGILLRFYSVMLLCSLICEVWGCDLEPAVDGGGPLTLPLLVLAQTLQMFRTTEHARCPLEGGATSQTLRLLHLWPRLSPRPGGCSWGRPRARPPSWRHGANTGNRLGISTSAGRGSPG